MGEVGPTPVRPHSHSPFLLSPCPKEPARGERLRAFPSRPTPPNSSASSSTGPVWQAQRLGGLFCVRPRNLGEAELPEEEKTKRSVPLHPVSRARPTCAPTLCCSHPTMDGQHPALFRGDSWSFPVCERERRGAGRANSLRHNQPPPSLGGSALSRRSYRTPLLPSPLPSSPLCVRRCAYYIGAPAPSEADSQIPVATTPPPWQGIAAPGQASPAGEWCC